MRSNISNSFKEGFHNKHEIFTEKAYSAQGMLPDRYIFILTNLCNLKCSFCFLRRDINKENMTTEDWINLAKQIPDYARITFTGGEPLLFSGFEQVFSFVANRFDCNIITNGLLLTEKKIDLFLSYPKFKVLSISIDDIDNSLRDVRPEQWKNVKNMMKYFIKKRKAINSDCVLEAKTMILDENAEDLFEIHKYCIEDLGCDHHSLQFLKGSPMQHADYMFEFEDIFKKSSAYEYKNFEIIKEQLELVRKYNIQNDKVAFLHPKIGSLVSEEKLLNFDFINKSKYLKENYLPCKFPWSSVHINVDGTLFPCLAVPMGNVKKKSLVEIINGQEFTRFKNIMRREGTVEACNRCGWLRPRHNL